MKKSLHSYVLAILVLLSVFDLSGDQCAMLFLCIAGLLCWMTKQRETLIPPVAFIAVAYILAFPLPILLPDLYPSLMQVPLDAQEYGMLWAVRGFGAFALGFVLVEQLRQRKKRFTWRDEALSIGRMRYTIYVLTSIGWLSLLAWIASIPLFGIGLTFIEGDQVAVDSGEGTLVQIFTLLSGLRYPFFLGFLLLHNSKQTDKHLNYLLVGLVVISIIEIIVIGSKGSIIRSIIVILLASSFIPVKINFKQIVIAMLALTVVYGSFAVITEYRSIMSDQLNSGRNVFDFTVQIESFGTALISSLPFSESSAARRTEVGHEDVFSRFGAGIFSFANLLRFTGRQPPYEYALESFLVPIYCIVPRSLLPNKPEFFHSGRNASEYYGWNYGGISVTLLGSLYFAWGYVGIIFGMAFIGGLLAYIIGQIRDTGLYSPQWIIFMVVLIVPILDVGQTFHAIITNFIRVFVLLWLLHLLYPLARGSMRRRVSRILSPIQRESHS